MLNGDSGIRELFQPGTPTTGAPLVECAFMKMNTLEKLYRCLRDETPEILMDSKLMDAARLPIERMFELS